MSYDSYIHLPEYKAACKIIPAKGMEAASPRPIFCSYSRYKSPAT